MKRYQDLIMMIAVVALIAIPLWMIKKPAPAADGKQAEIFTGADNKARDLIGTIAPAYKPWFTPHMEPPSSEIGSLLFALQAALGAGFIAYWYGSSSTKAKMRRKYEQSKPC